MFPLVFRFLLDVPFNAHSRPESTSRSLLDDRHFTTNSRLDLSPGRIPWKQSLFDEYEKISHRSPSSLDHRSHLVSLCTALSRSQRRISFQSLSLRSLHGHLCGDLTNDVRCQSTVVFVSLHRAFARRLDSSALFHQRLDSNSMAFDDDQCRSVWHLLPLATDHSSSSDGCRAYRSFASLVVDRWTHNARCTRLEDKHQRTNDR